MFELRCSQGLSPPNRQYGGAFSYENRTAVVLYTGRHMNKQTKEKSLDQHIQTSKQFFHGHKNEIFLALLATLGIVLITVIITLFTRSSAPNVVYQPVKACELLTRAEADKVFKVSAVESTNSQPVITKDTAVSKCGYTDGNAEVNDMIVAAVIVRSGVNDAGVLQNQSEFSSGKTGNDIEVVRGLGDGAYFNKRNGQLNVLDGRNWIILSYGLGSAPQSNSKDEVVELATFVVSGGAGQVSNF